MVTVRLDGNVEVTLTREQAEACLFALRETPYEPGTAQHAWECFLICQLADGLGVGAELPRWMRDAAEVVA